MDGRGKGEEPHLMGGGRGRSLNGWEGKGEEP